MALVRLFVLLQFVLCFSVITIVSYPTEAIDLTWPFNEKTISWYDNQKFVFTKQVTIEEPNGEWYSANEFATAEHAGTHVDSPYHFYRNGWKIGDIPLSKLIGNGIKIDVSNETHLLGDKALLLPKHLIDWEKEHGPIPENAIVLVYFNWGRHYHNQSKYLGGETLKDSKFPGISAEAAQWLADNDKVSGVGIDCASIDPGTSSDYPVHKILSKNNIFTMENVKIPSNLPGKGFSLLVMPMYIGEGTGAPARIIAYPQKQ